MFFFFKKKNSFCLFFSYWSEFGLCWHVANFACGEPGEELIPAGPDPQWDPLQKAHYLTSPFVFVLHKASIFVKKIFLIYFHIWIPSYIYTFYVKSGFTITIS
jgi:hypothetical protein